MPHPSFSPPCPIRKIVPSSLFCAPQQKCPQCRYKDLSSTDKAVPGRGKSRRKTGNDIVRSRQTRNQVENDRRPLLAQWGGKTLAESADYEFLDGRFYFPEQSVNWEFLRESGKRRHLNPLGLAVLYDVVIRRGKGTIRCRGAVAKFSQLKRPWHVMSGYSSFAKGVRVFARSDAEMRAIDSGDSEMTGE